ncbi:YARHG domain-containing protein [Ancylomarina salipaludis]|uniref:YARHG domain-containing protein n=1 Tax=Ancylomarina salipaludis TaxID=2501299 RepID=A0A4Q1JNC9_9BACT|nr:YARHG domain-containing protein [Ancylomarina salipaludis]RXQ95974.1 YARHG domain-containing protein [Ancylomarina salipaludis]
MKLYFIILITIIPSIIFGQNYNSAANLRIGASHCCDACCVFQKDYYFLPDSVAIKKEHISDYDNFTMIGTWKCHQGIVEMEFSDFYGGECVGKQVPSQVGCNTMDCDKYKSIHKQISENEIIDLNNLPDYGGYVIDSLKITDFKTFNWVTFQSSSKLLNETDLLSLTKKELRIKRNLIFARYGYIFKSKDLKDYFTNKDWYNPRYINVQHFLTNIDKENIDLILKFENK